MRASTSLPVPVSPVSVTVTSARARGFSSSNTRRIAGDAVATLRGERSTVGAGGGVLSGTEAIDLESSMGEAGYAEPSQNPLSLTFTTEAGARGISSDLRVLDTCG